MVIPSDMSMGMSMMSTTAEYTPTMILVFPTNWFLGPVG